MTTVNVSLETHAALKRLKTIRNESGKKFVDFDQIINELCVKELGGCEDGKPIDTGM